MALLLPPAPTCTAPPSHRDLGSQQEDLMSPECGKNIAAGVDPAEAFAWEAGV